MILKEINHQYLTPEQIQATNKVEKVIMESVQVLEPSLVAELARQNSPSTGPRVSQDPGLSVPHLSLLSSPVLHQVHHARGSRQPSAAAGSVDQQAGPVGRQGRKRPHSRHGEEDVPPPPQAPRVQVNPNKKYICDICGRGFSRSDDLRDHRISVHKIGEPWTCHDCNKLTVGRKALENQAFWCVPVTTNASPKKCLIVTWLRNMGRERISLHAPCARRNLPQSI